MTEPNTEKNQVPCSENVSLRKFSWFKTGGNATKIYFPTSVQQLADLVARLNREETSYKIIGETTNLLFLDDKRYGVLVSTTKLDSLEYYPERREIIAETGYPLPNLSRFALGKRVRGFAGLEGIPGTIDGAVFMNASAFGCGIGDCLSKVEILDLDGSLRTMDVEELKLSHRDSIFKSGCHPGVITRAFFEAETGDEKAIYRFMEDCHARRHRSLKYMYPNLGSIFAGSVYRSMGAKDLYSRICGALFYFFGYRFKSWGKETP